jgi:hypothetical protein
MSILLLLSAASAALRAEAADTATVTNTPAAAMSNSAAAEDVSSETKAPSPAEAVSEAEGAADTDEQAPAPEEKATKPVPEMPEGLHVSIQDGRLSVNVKDQAFGDVIAAIANAADFDVDLSNDVFDMKLSTRFKNAGLERGIMRLLSLIDQRNYSIDYGPDGSIKRLEVFGDLSSGQRSVSGSEPPKSAPATRRTRTIPPKARPQKAPPTPPTIVIKDREEERRRRQAAPGAPKAPGEPTQEEEVMELDYSIRRLPGGAEETTTEDSGESATPAVDPNDTDDDGDGYTENGGDCDDAVFSINPGATEICGDGIDQDCSGAD